MSSKGYVRAPLPLLLQSLLLQLILFSYIYLDALVQDLAYTDILMVTCYHHKFGPCVGFVLNMHLSIFLLFTA